LQRTQFAGIFIGAFGFSFDMPYNMMLTDWDSSIEPILSSADSISNRSSVSIQNSYYLKVNRDALIDPYDIQASINKIQDVQNIISSRLDRFNVQISSNLLVPLIAYLIISLAMNVSFISLSIPILFMAYFTGTMVSDVGYNLRRREIGLLLTKGYKRGTIRNMFLIEGMFVGAIAGAISVFLGAAVSYTVLGIQEIDFLTVLSNNTASIIISIILGMALALISVWRPANRASKLEILDALKQYVYVEETSEYKRLLPTISVILGTYKLVVWILGINISSLLSGASFGNLFIAIGILVWVGIDSILNYAGPIMFLFGATKLFMRGSQKFQKLVVSAGSRFFGAFGKLATRNVERNPARTAAMVFLISLIVSYGVYTSGALFSEYDRVERANYYEVGSDVRLELDSDANTTAIMEELPKLEEVLSITPEYRMDVSSGSISLELRGIRPEEWSTTAFWEPQWFLGDFETMLDSLDDDGIILSVTVANDLALEVGDSIFVRRSFLDDPHELTIVGLIGYVSVLEMVVRGGPFGDVEISSEGDYPSFVSESFLNESELLSSATTNILIKTTPGTNGTAIQEYVSESIDGVENSYSFTSQMENYFATPIQSGVTKIQWVAIVFAVILACVGTGLVIILSLKEKDAEIALITVRGFTKWQLFKTLMAEMLVMVIFSLLLGTVVGLIQVFGNVSQLNEGATGLIQSRVVLGGMTAITMLGIIGVVLLGAAIPVMLASRRPEAKVDVLRA
jgi:ABC-type antimicrobial peptide transport system permease subunit